MMKVKIGQVLQLKEDVEMASFLTDTKIVYKAGTEILVTANGCVVYPDGSIQKLDRTHDVAGYDVQAISKNIAERLDWNFSLADECDFELNDIQDVIESFLEEILN